MSVDLTPQANPKIMLEPRGSFEEEDKPRRIIGITRDTEDYIDVRIEWEKRGDKMGTLPRPSRVAIEEAKKKCPDLLLNFLESKIKII